MDAKKQSILVSIIGVFTLIVAVIGATYAWFTVSMQGNDEASDVIVKTANLGTVVFSDSEEINLQNIRPGSSATKTFTISNTDPEATEPLEYRISFDVSQNTLTPVAEGYFVYSVSGVASGTGTVMPSITNQIVPTTTTVIGTGTLNGYETHTYTFTINFNESGTNQNAAQNKLFNGKIQVSLVAY